MPATAASTLAGSAARPLLEMGSYWIDGLVLLAYFALIFGIGLSQRSKSGSMEGFALGDRQIAWWAVLASILAAEISAGTFFGAPGEGYALRNFTYVQLIVGYLLARIVVSAVFIPAYYKHNVVSIYEFLGQRFGPVTHRVSSGVFLITRLLASGTRLWVPTMILVLVWHLHHPDQSITPATEFWLTAVALVLVTLATAIYTTVGGIRAVIWTDVIQILVLVCALGFSLNYLLGHIPGGWDGAKAVLTGPKDLKVWDTGLKSGVGFWENVKGVLEQEYTIWAAFLGSTFVTLATHGTDQDMVQRMLTAKNKRQSAVATMLSGLADVPITLVVLGIGILLYVFYQQHPDPLLPSTNGVVSANKVFPHFVLTVMPAGLRGLIIAGVLATTMGSLSTALNSLATSYVKDFHFRWFGEPAEEKGKVRALRFGTVLFAVLLISVALATAWVTAHKPGLRILPIILGIFGYTYGSLLGVFMVGLFTRTRGNDRGNVIAMITGFIVVAYLSGLDSDVAKLCGGHGIPRPEWMPVIEFPWRIMFGTIVTFAVAVSFRTPRGASKI
ncbi:sodium:solute symporter [Luteolibacter ambystomatis]|uniref:Sodium:solute symporter n=1 Tax=Luteolibacter ambystomatis TaxID=2824561 RepID=A0A975IZK7_9BACT|nr:sodium:solute symporter [Luteolibacter ambystomatis]QUE51299.1 sodium:solute symporter [Luteolibacter ambystomatis]